jgi:hypothetical protein
MIFCHENAGNRTLLILRMQQNVTGLSINNSLLPPYN